MQLQQRTARRKRVATSLVAGAALSLLAVGPAMANHDGWEAKDGTTIDGDAIVLDTTDAELTPDGTSYENTDLGEQLATGGEVTFDYTLSEGAVCGGGQPRVFIEVDGTYYNTFDGNEDACGEGGAGSTSGTVTYTYEGDPGEIGHAGIVFDNVSNRGVATVTNVSIGGYNLDVTDVEQDPEAPQEPEAPEAKDECKKGGYADYGFRNQGQCIRYVNTGKDSRA